MGKLFNHKKHHFSDDYSDEKEENDELESDELEEAEAEEIRDEESDEKEDLKSEEIEDEEIEENESKAEEIEDDEPEENESETEEVEEDEIKEDEAEAEEIEEDELKEGEQEDGNSKEDESEDDEAVSLTDEDTEKADRRYYRRKRRIRNQIIAYGIMSIFLAVLIAAGVVAGRRIANYVREKKQAEELAALLEQQKEELEQQEQQDEKPTELVIETPPADIIEMPSPEEQLDEIVNKCISEMPLNDRVASLFIVTPEALTGVGTVTQAGEATREALSEYAIGGLIYFEKNIKDREQLTEMLSKTVLCSKYPIFLAVDEEGGTVSRIGNSNIDVVKVDEMSVIGTSQDAVAAHEAGTTIGTYLKELGFNLDFAPVADVVTDGENSVLGSRSFGTDAAVAADMVSNVVQGMQEAGVNACLKHFPGLGSAEEDTHDGRVEITKTLEEMQNSDFIPFQAGIEAGANIVMVSHVTASFVDTEGLPSSLSKVVITDVLRGELGFDGVVITDALNMSAISEYYTADEAAVMAIAAGADMLLMPEDFETAYNGLLAAVQEGTISEERINESLRRIFRIKYADKIE